MQPINRREFIAGLTGLASFGFNLPYPTDKNTPPAKPVVNDQVIEWNAHLFSSDTTKYPFHPKATYQPDPSNYPDDPLRKYLAYLDQSGIDKAVVVHPEPYGDDHSLILDALKQSPNRLKGTCLFYPQDSAAPGKLLKLVKANPDIIATRFHAHRGKETYLKSFSDPGVRALWKQAVELDMIIELHIGPNYAISATEAIRSFPGCKVLIDHLAEPHLGDAVEFADVLRMADLPNVYMKFSGLAHFADDGPAFLSARTFTSQVIKAFGPERLVMGGVDPGTVDLHMEDYSNADRAKVKGLNLQQLLKWH
jgi:predicted TIM-barrel fold metal-dependent hydrolase